MWFPASRFETGGESEAGRRIPGAAFNSTPHDRSAPVSDAQSGPRAVRLDGRTLASHPGAAEQIPSRNVGRPSAAGHKQAGWAA
jgi:hypothetical protein